MNRQQLAPSIFTIRGVLTADECQQMMAFAEERGFDPATIWCATVGRENGADQKPSYMMWLEWRDGRISFIRDYRYVRYVVAEVELEQAPDSRRG